jgi:hypothetical protein
MDEEVSHIAITKMKITKNKSETIWFWLFKPKKREKKPKTTAIYESG